MPVGAHKGAGVAEGVSETQSHPHTLESVDDSPHPS